MAPKLIPLNNEAEWHTLHDALSQFVENTREYVAEHSDDPSFHDPLAVQQLEIAEGMLENMDADLARMAD